MLSGAVFFFFFKSNVTLTCVYVVYSAPNPLIAGSPPCFCLFSVSEMTRTVIARLKTLMGTKKEEETESITEY